MEPINSRLPQVFLPRLSVALRRSDAPDNPLARAAARPSQSINYSKGESGDDEGLPQDELNWDEDQPYIEHDIMRLTSLEHPIKLMSVIEVLSFIKFPHYLEFQTQNYLTPLNYDCLCFISHRWSTQQHPDHKNDQLEQLKILCGDGSSILPTTLFFYDFSCVPQDLEKLSEIKDEHRAVLQTPYLSNRKFILRNINTLLTKQMLILGVPNDEYFQRVWCYYEYIIGSMRNIIGGYSTNDSLLVALKDAIDNHRKMKLRKLMQGSLNALQTRELDKSEKFINKARRILKRNLNSCEVTNKCDRELLMQTFDEYFEDIMI